ncbi:MAG TPA: 3-deoxy-D-manno-octulosonic acid kinase [Steroidobacteraceae bacterium]|nr:3-deoxy-D-manno-octulosonic acid kinase [Steroidobacteraceae bacterium]
MAATHEQVLRLEAAGIVYDAARVRKPELDLFDRHYWRVRNGLEEVPGGRGSVAFVEADNQRWVLRHYRRGGLIARLFEDRYLWRGEDRTRSFAEWRLLAELKRLDLPVPTAIAACYRRDGLFYTADLITEALVDTITLAQALRIAPLPEAEWHRIGETIARFHSHGVHHADLNANNILLNRASGDVYLLDFDRGRIRPRGAWEQDVLARLHRSLTKLRARSESFHFRDRDWQWLLQGQH